MLLLQLASPAGACGRGMSATPAGVRSLHDGAGDVWSAGPGRTLLAAAAVVNWLTGGFSGQNAENCCFTR